MCGCCAEVFEDEASMNKLEDVKLGDFGRAAEVTITKDDCLMMNVITASVS